MPKKRKEASADLNMVGQEEIAAMFEELSIMLEILGANPFRCRAYANAARILDSLTGDLREMVASGELLAIKGIGKGIFNDIASSLDTGSFALYDETREKIPDGVLQMLRIPGFGPKKVKAVYETLNITSIEQLETAAKGDKLAGLSGFGAKTQEKILAGIENLKKYQDRFLYSTAEIQAEEIRDAIAQLPEVERHLLAGSLRRCRETIGDIDILVSARKSEVVMDTFTTLPRVRSVVAKGPTKSSVIYGPGINVDLRVVKDEEFAFATHYFTGSKDHNTEIRGRAKRLGFRLNEYGLFAGDVPTPCKDEEVLFAKLGLDYIAPELREAMGEIEAAERHELPELLEDADIRGVFHNHTSYSDGRSTLEEMVRAAQSMGHRFFGLGDHSQTAGYANGLTPDRVQQQRDEVAALNEKLKNFTVFFGIESDILSDGSLDYADDVLETFDYIVSSVHSNFGMSETAQTERLIKAIENPFTTMLGHATGRLLLTREGYKLDMKAVIDAAVENDVILEINAHPQRLDLDWRYIKYAKEKGALFAISPDAHHTSDLDYYRYGVGIARKGWLTKNDVINTMSVAKIRKIFRQRKK
jgi:DNA polymerase (family 10)